MIRTILVEPANDSNKEQNLVYRLSLCLSNKFIINFIRFDDNSFFSILWIVRRVSQLSVTR